ncbi:MAG: NAD(P)-dependent oxidoreductase [Chloroflexota bacterium]|nr:NAD(P)-dependent oxidoreductase [Chloroflexota bacterium]
MRVGWIGAGNIGRQMAKHVLEAGHELTVHDLRREAASELLETGARWAASPAEATRGKDIVFTSLPVPRDVDAVAVGEKGILGAMSGDEVFVDLTTNSLSMVVKLHKAFLEKGFQMLDAPVSGGVRGAISRDLIVMASGDEATYRRIKPVLDAMGDKVTYCGPIGNGTICKLCHNLMGAGIVQVVAEVLSLGVKAGVPLETLADAISKGASGKVPPLKGWYDTTFKGQFEGTPLSFYLELMRKDVRLACEMARELDVPMEIANIVEQRHIEAMNRGWGRNSSNAIVWLQEQRSGVELRLRS